MNRIANLLAALALTLPAAALADDTCDPHGLITQVGSDQHVDIEALVPALVAYAGIYGSYPMDTEVIEAMGYGVDSGGGEVWLSLSDYKVGVDATGSNGARQYALVTDSATQLAEAGDEVMDKVDGLNDEIDAAEADLEQVVDDAKAVSYQLEAVAKKLERARRLVEAGRLRPQSYQRLEDLADELKAELMALKAEREVLRTQISERVEQQASLRDSADAMYSGSNLFKTLSCVLKGAAGSAR